MSDYIIRGRITDSNGNAVTELKVQAMESDQGLFEDRNDDLLGSGWVKNNGTFGIVFGKNQFKERLVEGKPDIYLIIRNKPGEIIHTTGVRKGVKSSDTNRLTFNIKLDPIDLKKRVKPPPDPYSDNNNRRITAFSSFGERANFTDDLGRSFTLLLSTLNAWAGYNNEHMWKKIGYDGPQVKRYPWRTQHKPHKVKWKK